MRERGGEGERGGGVRGRREGEEGEREREEEEGEKESVREEGERQKNWNQAISHHPSVNL